MITREEVEAAYRALCFLQACDDVGVETQEDSVQTIRAERDVLEHAATLATVVEAWLNIHDYVGEVK